MRTTEAVATGQEDRGPAAQGNWASPCPRHSAGMDVFRARESEGRGLAAACPEGPGPCRRTAGPEGRLLPLHLGSESVSDLPTPGAAERHGRVGFQPAGWRCLWALPEAP